MQQSFEKIGKWKSIEFRQFTLYAGIVILKDLLPHDAYWHFLLYHTAYRLLDDPRYSTENVSIADALFNEKNEKIGFPSYKFHSYILQGNVKNGWCL